MISPIWLWQMQVKKSWIQLQWPLWFTVTKVWWRVFDLVAATSAIWPWQRRVGACFIRPRQPLQFSHKECESVSLGFGHNVLSLLTMTKASWRICDSVVVTSLIWLQLRGVNLRLTLTSGTLFLCFTLIETFLSFIPWLNYMRLGGGRGVIVRLHPLCLSE